MRKIISFMLAAMTVFALSACTQAYADLPKYKDMSGYEDADVSEYNIQDDVNGYAFKSMGTQDVLDAIEAKETFVVVFAQPACGACKRAVPGYAELSAEYNIPFGMVNTRANPEWTSNKDIDHYDELCEVIGEYFQTDSDGSKHLYTPHLFMFREGSVVFQSSAAPIVDKETNVPSSEEKKSWMSSFKNGLADMGVLTENTACFLGQPKVTRAVNGDVKIELAAVQAKGYSWYFYSPELSTGVREVQLPDGLVTKFANSDSGKQFKVDQPAPNVLTMTNIPDELSDWSVEAICWGENKDIYASTGKISIGGAESEQSAG